MKRSVIYIWIATYLIVWAIPFGFGMLNYYSADVSLQKSIDEINAIAVRSAGNEVERIFLQQSRAIESLSEDECYQRLISMTDEEFAASRDSMTRFVDALSRSLRDSNESIDSVSVFFQNLDTVITSMGFCLKDLYKDAYFSDTALSDKDFQRITAQYHKSMFMRLDRKGSIGNVILFVQSIGKEKSFSNVIVAMNEKSLVNNLIKNKFIADGSFVAFDKDGSTFFSNCEESLCNLVNETIGSADSGIFELVYKNKKYVAAVGKMNVGGRKYVYILERNAFYVKTNALSKLAYGGAFACLLLGMGVVAYAVSKNYKPIKLIMKTVNPEADSEKKKYKNEYDVISHRIMDITDELNSTRKSLKRHIRGIREFELHKIIHGEFSEEMQRFRFDSFMLAYACIDDCSDIFYEGERRGGLSEAKYVIRNILTEMFETVGDVYSIEYDDMIGFVLNFPNEENGSLKCSRLIMRSEEIIKKEFNILFSVLSSNVQHGEIGPAEAYKQICELISYRKSLSEPGTNLSFDDINSSSAESIIYYPILEERRLVNCLQRGEEQESLKCIKEIADKNLSGGAARLYVIKGLQCCIAGTLIKVAANLKTDDEQALERVRDATEILGAGAPHRDMEDFYNKAEQCIKSICSAERTVHNTNESPYVIKAVNYINENYADSSLSLTSIADYLGIHRDYISKLFKLSRNISIPDYVNSIRIKHAALYLQNTELTAAEIAEKVGFNNIQSFNRVFKSAMGVPPGKYRDMTR